MTEPTAVAASTPAPAPAQGRLGLRVVLVVATVLEAPLMAACATALAARNQRLGLASALTTVPTFYSLIGLIIFAIGIGIYGF